MYLDVLALALWWNCAFPGTPLSLFIDGSIGPSQGRGLTRNERSLRGEPGEAGNKFRVFDTGGTKNCIGWKSPAETSMAVSERLSMYSRSIKSIHLTLSISRPDTLSYEKRIAIATNADSDNAAAEAFHNNGQIRTRD